MAGESVVLRGFAAAMILPAVLLGAAGAALAEETSALKLRDIVAKGAKQLSAEEVQQLLPGAKVTSTGGGRGVIRRWENAANGRFVASGHDPTTTTARMQSFQGQGSWRIDDGGRYCVTIEWPKRTEQWCRVLFKLDDRYYGVKSAGDEDAELHALEFRR